MQTTEPKTLSPEEEAKVGELFLKHKDKVRTLEEARAVAKEIGLAEQVTLYDREIEAVGKRWKIDHQNTYQECTPDDARRAFCEPSQVCQKHTVPECRGCRLRDLPCLTVFKWHLLTEKIEFAPKHSLADALAEWKSQEQGNTIQFNQLGQGQPQQMYRSIYAQVPTTDPILYPMGALLKLKEAIGKDLFDRFECWRPVSREEKLRLEDPWLVGRILDGSKGRYFKIADWR